MGVVIMEDIEYNDFADLEYTAWYSDELEVEEEIDQLVFINVLMLTRLHNTHLITRRII